MRGRIAASVLLMAVMLGQVALSAPALTGPLGTAPASRILVNPEDLGPTTFYALSDDFSDSDLSDWYQWKGDASATIAVTSGELHLKNNGWASVHVRHPLNVSSQRYNLSFNFRMASGTAPQNNPYLAQLDSSIYSSSPAAYAGTAVYIRLRSNLSLEFTVDNGLKKSVPGLSYAYSAPLAYDTNYQFYLDFAPEGVYDKVHILIVDKSTESAHFDQVYTTWGTNINCSRPLPDRISFGAVSHAVNNYMDWYLDNLTAWQYAPDTSAAPFNESAVEAGIAAFGEELLDIEFDADTFRLGYLLTDATWDSSPVYFLEPYLPTNSRDDVAGDIMGSTALLYEYTGNASYLSLAEDIWAVLATHQQPDGGFTFGANTTDYCSTDARIILGLLALYRATGDSSYLDEVEPIADWMLGFQQSNGRAYSRVVRPATYSIDYDMVETGYLALSMLEAYKWTANDSYREAAELSLGWLAGLVTESGRVPSLAYGTTHADNNDVVVTGIALWALSEGYKLLGNATYLFKAQYVAAWLASAQWANATAGYGLWCGHMKERHNQSDLLYNYVCPIGLLSYASIAGGSAAVNGAVNASLEFTIAAQGHDSAVNGATLYGTDGVWGASWNLNDTADQGWTTGWWCEGGWGTWGLVAFYGWQGHLIKALLESDTVETPGAVYERSMVAVNGTSYQRGLFSCGDEPVTLAISSTAASHCLVSSSDLANTTIDSEVLNATITTTGATVTTLVVTGQAGTSYKLYLDGTPEGTADGPSMTFNVTGPALLSLVVWGGLSANFTYTSADTLFYFESTSTGDIVTYLWDFGDGTTSSLEDPPHTYDSWGDYTVTLTVYEADGWNTTTTSEVSIDEPDYILYMGLVLSITLGFGSMVIGLAFRLDYLLLLSGLVWLLSAVTLYQSISIGWSVLSIGLGFVMLFVGVMNVVQENP